MFIIKISVRYIFWQNHFKSKFNVFIVIEIFNKSSTANYFLTSQLNNQFWIKSICNYQIAKDENSIKSKSGHFFCFSILSLAIAKSRKSINLLWFLNLIFSSFFRNHTKFYFVRLTFSCAAEHVRAPMRLPWRHIFRFNLWEYNCETENMQWELHLRSKC